MAPSGFVSAMLATMEEAKQLDVASDGDLASCSPDWSSDEETTRMQILLLQANWAKPARKRKVLLMAREKRKKFAKLIRRFRTIRGDGEAKTCPTQLPHASDDVGAPNVELLAPSGPGLPLALAH